jgi:diguanylate cyclase (GGDEF)-like protein
MSNIVLIAPDRVGLARVGDALRRAGYQVEAGADLADAEILIRATSAELLIVDVDDRITRDLQLLGELIKKEPGLGTVMILGPMPPPAEQELIEITQSMGVQVHLPRQLANTPFFASVMEVIIDRHRLRQANTQLGGDLEVIRTRQVRTHSQGTLIPDFAYLQDQLKQELSMGANLSLMIIGINEFEEIQQKRGQRAADQLVQDLGELIRGDLRDTDIVTHTPVRERLAVLLPLTEAVHAKIVASRIQVKMARRSLGAASLSAGIVQARPGMNVNELISHANEAWRKAQREEDKLYVL